MPGTRARRRRSNARLVTRNSISLVFPLPLSYENRIRGVEGVTQVARSSWFAGTYRDPKNFFAQFAVSDNYIDLYPELILPPEQRADYRRDRRGALVGRQLADQYGFKIGDVIPLKGTIYPGTWDFVVRGIMEGREESTITRADAVPLRVPEREHPQEGRRQAGPGGRVHPRHRQPGQRRRGLRAAWTTSSATRWPRP